MESLGIVFHEGVAYAAFVGDDVRDDFLDVTDDLFFAFAEGRLIGDLIEIPHCLASFTVQAANRQTDFVQGLEDLLDLLGDNESREVEHDADANPRTDIRGASRQVTELFVESEADPFFELVVDVGNFFPAAVEIETASQRLDADVVFFIDHQADVFGLIEADAARAFAFGEFAADELAFDEELTVDPFEGGDVDEGELRASLRSQAGDFPREEIDDFLTDLMIGPGEKGELGHITGKSDAAGDDDVGFRPGAPEPFAARRCHRIEIHGGVCLIY